MTITAERQVVTEPGVYDLPDDVYHGDPVPAWSLSVSGAKTIVTKSAAKYLHERKHGRKPKAEFEFGHAAHKLVLGVGPKLVLVDRSRWDTNDVKEQVAEIRAAGDVPLKRDAYEAAQKMAAALRQHDTAAALLAPDTGTPEQSLFWQDDRAGIWRRGRLDWLPSRVSAAGRMLIADYKTADSAHPDDFSRAAASYGYHQQAAWYIDAVRALGLAEDASFLFVVQEKEPPYLVSIVELHPDALLIGDHLNRQAIRTFAEGVSTGNWPGYDPDVHLVRLPAYVERKYEQEINQ